MKIKLFHRLDFQYVAFYFIEQNNRATSSHKHVYFQPVSVSCKTKLLLASSHFHFDIVSTLWGLFVFGTVSGLIKLPHKMIHVDDKKNLQCMQVLCHTEFEIWFSYWIFFVDNAVDQHVENSSCIVASRRSLIKSFQRLEVLRIQKQSRLLFIEIPVLKV